MLLDRPIPRALFYSHVRLEAKGNASDALSRANRTERDTKNHPTGKVPHAVCQPNLENLGLPAGVT
jgi:hypothetical protein